MELPAAIGKENKDKSILAKTACSLSKIDDIYCLSRKIDPVIIIVMMPR